MSSTRHATVIKTAVELQTGDVIVSEGTFPYSLYAGMVYSTVAVDAGIQVNLASADGQRRDGCYVRAEDHKFEVVA